MATTYDYNTGKPLAEGQAQSVYNTQTGQKIGEPMATPTSTSAPTVITPSSLAPTKDITLPDSTYKPTTQNVGTSVDTTLSKAGSVDTTAPKPLTAKQESDKKLLELQDRIAGTADNTSKITSDANLVATKQKVVEFKSNLDTMDKAYRDEVAQIKQNAQGGFGGNLNQLINQATDRYQNTRANAAINYNQALGDYQAVKDDVDLKIASYKDQTTQALQAWQLQASAINDDLTESEKIQLQAKNAEKLQETTVKNEAYSSAIANAVQNGASTAVLTAIDNASRQPNATAASIMAAAGRYGVDSVKKAQVAKIYADIKNDGTVSIGGSGANTKYGDALKTILGSGKFTKDQVRLITNSINNGEDPLTVIKNNARNIMPDGGKDTQKIERAKDSLIDIQNNLKSFYEAGGKTNIFSGNIEKTINRLGEVNDPRLVDLAVQIQSGLQTYRNAVSGTAYSVQEGKDIASIFPGINKSQGLNDAIIKGRLRAFDSDIDSSYKGVLGSNYDSLKGSDTQSKPMTVDQEYEEYLKASSPNKSSLDLSNITSGGSSRAPYSSIFNLSSFTKK